MGGDVLAGTNFVDALKVFEHDQDTDGIVLIGEIGGTAEIDAAEWIKGYNSRSANPKLVKVSSDTRTLLIMSPGPSQHLLPVSMLLHVGSLDTPVLFSHRESQMP